MGAEDMRRQTPNVERMDLLGAEVRAGRVRHADAEGGDERGDPRLDHERRDDALPDRLLRRPRALPGDRARAAGGDRPRGARAARSRPRAGCPRPSRLRRRRLERDRHVRRLPRRRRCRARRRRGGGRAPASAPGGRPSCTARAPRCSPTRTARSPTRTRSPPGSTTPASAPSTPSCATPAAPATSRATDEEALAAFRRLTRTEGIIPALEPAHALARVARPRRRARPRLPLRPRRQGPRRSASAADDSEEARHLPDGGPATPELAEAAVEGGADIVELGFPFSDPLADGPVIRRAAERALARGCARGACLECLAEVRERVGRRAARPDDVRVAPRGLRLGALRGRRARPPARRA